MKIQLHLNALKYNNWFHRNRIYINIVMVITFLQNRILHKKMFLENRVLHNKCTFSN